MMYLYETHLHTSPVSACAVSAPAEQVYSYKKRGYAGIIVTDHFVNGNTGCPDYLSWEEQMRFFASGYEDAKKVGEKCGLDVFFGLEYSIQGADILTYGLDLDFLLANPGIDSVSLGEYSKLVRKNGGYLAQAHPFRQAVWIPAPFPVDVKFIDGMEVFNANMRPHINRKAMDFARRHNLAEQSGSDSHGSYVPFASGIALRKKAESIFDIISALKNKQAELILPE